MEETQPSRRSPKERTSLTHRDWDVEDLQPIPRPLIQTGDATQPYEVTRSTIPMPVSYRRRSCLSSLFMTMVTLLIAAGVLVALSYAFSSWAASRPRTTVLVMGLDRRPEQGDVVRADTMLLLSVSPSGPRATMLSIPRDLYVDIPGRGPDRINTAHFWGENAAAGNGPTLAMQTVQQNFGVPVNHYVRIDFEGFRAIVDAAGGVDILVEQAIVDDAYPTEDYGTMRIEIPAGLQHMDGETALRYARSRHGSSDFDRTRRQQQVLTALAQRLLRPEGWTRLPAVYQAVNEHVETDMGAGDMLALAAVLYRVGPEGIERRTIEREMTQSWTTPSGASVLLPRWELIQPLIQELFTP